MRAYDLTISGSAVVSGSVTASYYKGDGSAITGVTAEWDGSHTGNGVITGDFNVTGNVTGSKVSASLGEFTSATIEGGTITGITDLAVADGGTGASTLNDLITLGTHTTGNYVGTITGGTGVTSTAATSGEGTTHSLSVDASQTQITSVGTIGTGTWQGTTVAVDQGGTGVTTKTGTGNVVLSSSPTLVTPALGTPASGVMTNVTGYPGDSSLVTTGTVTSGVWNSTFGAASNTTISGSFTLPSSSFSTRVTTEESNVDTLQSTMTSEQTNIDNLQTDSGSFSTRHTSAEATASSLISDYSKVQSLGTTDSPTFADLTATGTVTAQEFHTEFVSSSIMYTSGSTKFGDTSDDIHHFTGSIHLVNSGSVSGSATSTGSFGRVQGSTLQGTIVTPSQTNITGVGTIGTGVWNGTPITSAYLNPAQTAITSVGILTGLATSGVVGITVANVSGVTARTDADDLVIENTGHSGISIITNDDQTGNLVFGQASSNRTARVDYAGGTNVMAIGTTKASGQVHIHTADGTNALTLDASQNATFTGTVALADDKTLKFGASSDATSQWVSVSNIFATSMNADAGIITQQAGSTNNYWSKLLLGARGASTTGFKVYTRSTERFSIADDTGNATFAGDVLIKELTDGYATLTIRADGSPYQPFLSLETGGGNAVAGMKAMGTTGEVMMGAFGAQSTSYFPKIYSANAVALSFDTSQNATFAGDVLLSGNNKVGSTNSYIRANPTASDLVIYGGNSSAGDIQIFGRRYIYFFDIDDGNANRFQFDTSNGNATFAGNITTVGGMIITQADGSNTDAYFGLGNDADYGQIGANEIGLWNVNNNDFIVGTNNTLALTIDNSQNATFAGAVSITNIADDSIWKSAMTGEGSSHRGEFIHSYSDVASSGGTETTMYAWYKLKCPVGYSGAGAPRMWEITAHGTGTHAANSAVKKYMIVESNNNNNLSGNLNGTNIDLIYSRNSTGGGTYGATLNAHFWYKNNASHNNGEIYMRLTTAFREPAITVHFKTLGCVRQGSTYGAGNGTDVEFLGASTSSSTYDPGNNTEITVADVGADQTI